VIMTIPRVAIFINQMPINYTILIMSLHSFIFLQNSDYDHFNEEEILTFSDLNYCLNLKFAVLSFAPIFF